MATGDYVEYAWDHRNRLTDVTFKTAAGVTTKHVRLTYDALDRRIGKQVDDDGGGTFDREEWYAYDGADIVLAHDGAGSLTHRYLHGPAVDQVFADENALGEVLYGLADHQGTIRDVADYDAALDETTVANHVTYNAFGAIESQSAPSVGVFHSYTGQIWDADVEAFDYDARWYDAFALRFLSEDPSGFDAGDANLYRYVTNSPLNFTDPTGRTLFTPVTPVISSSLIDLALSERSAPIYDFVESTRYDPFAWSPGTFGPEYAADRFRTPTTFSDHVDFDPDSELPWITFRGPARRVEVIHGMWDNYDMDLAATGRSPGLFERFAVAIGRVVLPDSDPTTVIHYQDGSTLTLLGGGPSSGELVGQAGLLLGGYGAASGAASGRGGSAFAREVLRDVATEGVDSVTGLPLSIAARRPSVPASAGRSAGPGFLDDYRSGDAALRLPAPQRPTWRQSELDVAAQLPGWRSQQSFLQGRPARYGAPGSVRPDLSHPTQPMHLDVKNRNLSDPVNRAFLYSDVELQSRSRARNLPSGSIQGVILDIRGQQIDPRVLDRIPTNIETVTEGRIRAQDVIFMQR